VSPILVELPPVPGDPAGMRVLAAALRSDGAGLAEAAAAVLGRVDSLEFYGPAADRIDARIGATCKRCGAVAEQLLVLAAVLERAATEVEAEQRARQHKLEELRRSSIGGGG
jgi:hypothetical protein